MTYSVGAETLAVHEEVPPIGENDFPPTLSSIQLQDLNDFLNGPNGWDVAGGRLQNTGPSVWTKIKERMGYIVNLFRTRHLVPELMLSPYTTGQLEAIAENKMPERPW